MIRWVSILSAIVLAITPMLVAADGQDTPVLLVVEVPAVAGTAGYTAEFDLASLQALPETGFETETIWTNGPQQFTGVALAALVQHLGVSGGMLKAYAINDYAVEIPVTDAVDGGPIIAYKRNGASMSIRDKGPLWIVYPYDSDPAYKAEAIYSRSIWQLVRIVVKPSK